MAQREPDAPPGQARRRRRHTEFAFSSRYAVASARRAPLMVKSASPMASAISRARYRIPAMLSDEASFITRGYYLVDGG